MVRPRDQELAQRLEFGLCTFDKEKRPLYGIRDPVKRDVLVEQLLESIHRVKYVSVVRARKLSGRRADPNDELFDPLKAAILHQRAGHIDEAFWLVFLFVHFGKHSRAGWRYVREIYGRLGDGRRWDWAHVSGDPKGFRDWLSKHQEDLKRKDAPHGFGNHRKYESLDAYSDKGTGAVVESYVEWVKLSGSHLDMINEARRTSGDDPRRTFDHLYQSMHVVKRFGRLARFDYLTMIGKLDLAPIEPGSAYLRDATGPLKGARLLFGGSKSAALNAEDLDVTVPP